MFKLKIQKFINKINSEKWIEVINKKYLIYYHKLKMIYLIIFLLYVFKQIWYIRIEYIYEYIYIYIYDLL